MNLEQSVIPKIINKVRYGRYIRAISASSSLTGKQDFRHRIRNAVSFTRQHSEVSADNDSKDCEVANRVVHLHGYQTHAEVVRAYLEFAGIDPDSKEGQFYFAL